MMKKWRVNLVLRMILFHRLRYEVLLPFADEETFVFGFLPMLASEHEFKLARQSLRPSCRAGSLVSAVPCAGSGVIIPCCHLSGQRISFDWAVALEWIER